ncbi:MAG TPA: alpha/beta hydrolase [Acidimicrobiia bacterium]|nr:alpha/beta hydrolase [Acidimicrobiia bacterium]
MSSEIHWNLHQKDGEPDVEIWLLHGLGDSSKTWANLFAHPGMSGLQLTAPDLPGFGLTPSNVDETSLDHVAHEVIELIDDRRRSESIFLVGHSMGGDLGTLIAQSQPSWLRQFVNVEGNLTEGDTFISKAASESSDFNDWFEGFIQTIQVLTDQGIIDESCMKSLQQCSRSIFLSLALDMVRRANEMGTIFSSLEIDTSYWYSANSISQQTLQLLTEQNIKSIDFKGKGHWIMHDKTDEFVNALNVFVDNLD